MKPIFYNGSNVYAPRVVALVSNSYFSYQQISIRKFQVPYIEMAPPSTR